MADARFAFRPFPEQVRFFARKVNIPTARWDDLMRADHAHGFMVAGAARAELLNDLREAVRAAIEDGQTLADFRARFDEIVARRGWTGWTGEESDARRAWRTRTIYRTNLRTSYMAGRWQQLRDGFPYLRYRHNTLRQPREQHQAWDGLILAADDPWWQEHYPPNGWGCNCDVEGISHARMSMLREDGQPDPTPPAAPGAVPDEWAYHVGEAARSMPAAAALGERIMQLPPAWREIALADAQQRPTALFGDWPGLLTRVAGELAAGQARARGTALPVGFMWPDVAGALEAGAMAGRPLGSPPPATALLAVLDRQVYHLARNTPARRQVDELIWQAMEELPQRLADPATVVFWDKGLPSHRNPNPGLIYVWPLPDGRWVRVVFGVNEDRGDRAMRQAGQRANWLRSAHIVAERDLMRPGYELIRGNWE